MQGTIRTYEKDTMEKIISRVESICKSIVDAMECTVDCDIERQYPAVINYATEASHIHRLATKWFGSEHVTDHDLPLTAAEDFSYFLHEKPGCFFVLGTLKPG